MKPVWAEFLEKFGAILWKYPLDIILNAYTAYFLEGEKEAQKVFAAHDEKEAL